MTRSAPKRPAQAPSPRPASGLRPRLAQTRRLSLELAAPLSPEDMTVQAHDDASPTKWHLAHTTWFFETFVLRPHAAGYCMFDEAFAYCFNSYYESEGARQPRSSRGLLSRPSCESVFAYRAHVDAALEALLAQDVGEDIARLIELGINHEQQHQELMLSDILALFAASPLRPAYRAPSSGRSTAPLEPLRYVRFPGGIRSVGHESDGFAWDNEHPFHSVLLQRYALADRLTSNGEWLEFIADGGYRRPLLWLADGWAMVRREAWQAPLYWEQRDGTWLQMTLEGLQPVDLAAPVCHVSYYEADAFARWAGRRLPTEFEWEVAARSVPFTGNTLGAKALRPLPCKPDPRSKVHQMAGDVWEWTASAYLPYPGFRAPEGALGEYNGKFMVSQHVLRGASFATPDGHSRPTYRNFFYPHQRWQFTGVRLASDGA